MLKNKIVSSGFTVDEELEDKQKEEEAMRRITESQKHLNINHSF